MRVKMQSSHTVRSSVISDVFVWQHVDSSIDDGQLKVSFKCKWASRFVANGLSDLLQVIVEIRKRFGQKRVT